MRNLLFICFLALPFLGTAQDFISLPLLLEIGTEQADVSTLSLEQLDWSAQHEEVESALEQANIDFTPYRPQERMPKTSFRHGTAKVSIYYNEKGISQVEIGRDLSGEKSETMTVAEELATTMGEAFQDFTVDTQAGRTGTTWRWKSKDGACALMYRHSGGSASMSISCQKAHR